jgi:hypothetical protein
MIKKQSINLYKVICYQGKLSERVGRKARGLKAGSDGGVLTTLPDDLNSSKPGCRGDNILLSESLLTSRNCGFFILGLLKFGQGLREVCHENG